MLDKIQDILYKLTPNQMFILLMSVLALVAVFLIALTYFWIKFLNILKWKEIEFKMK